MLTKAVPYIQQMRANSRKTYASSAPKGRRRAAALAPLNPASMLFSLMKFLVSVCVGVQKTEPQVAYWPMEQGG